MQSRNVALKNVPKHINLKPKQSTKMFENFSNDKFVCKQAVCLYSLFDFQIQIEGWHSYISFRLNWIFWGKFANKF